MKKINKKWILLIIFLFLIFVAITYTVIKDTHAIAGGDELLLELEKVKTGEKKLTYEMFGAKGDGVTNDYLAIKQTHDWANKLYVDEGTMITVHGTKGKTYYLGVFNSQIDVITNVNWEDAKFIVDDFIDENNDNLNDVNTNKAIFNITNPMYVKCGIRYLEFKKDEIESNFKVNKTTKNLSNVINAVKKSSVYLENSFVRKQFFQAKYWVVSVTNSNKQYIRKGVNANSGSYQTEVILIDGTTGDVLSDINWDYNDITSIIVYPISENTININNGFFETWTNNRVYTDNGGTPERRGYSFRNIYVNYTGNVVISNIKHKIDEKKHKYEYEYQSTPYGNQYNGFIQIDNTAFIKMKDVYLTPRTFVNIVTNKEITTGAHGTYDLVMNNSTNVYLDNVSYYCDSSMNETACYEQNMLVYDENGDGKGDKWGIMATNRLKNVFITNSKLNVIDAHQGITNLYLSDTIIGNSGFSVIGNGYLYAKNIKVDGPSWMISLPGEYGSSWDGNIVIDGAQYIVGGREVPEIFRVRNSQDHYFGYTTYFPNVYIRNMNIDTSQSSSFSSLNFLNINNSTISNETNDNSKYYFKENIYVQNISITNNGTINFISSKNNMNINNYGGNNIVNLYLDDSINVYSEVSDSKFNSVSSMNYNFDTVESYFNNLIQKNDIFNDVPEFKIFFEEDVIHDKNLKYIKYIENGTSISAILDKIYTSGATAYVYDAKNKKKNIEDALVTGDKLVLLYEDTKKDEYIFSVIGDSSGDGKIDSLDLAQIRKHLIKWKNPDTGIIFQMTGVYKEAFDLNHDGKTSALDLAIMRKKVNK